MGLVVGRFLGKRIQGISASFRRSSGANYLPACIWSQIVAELYFLRFRSCSSIDMTEAVTLQPLKVQYDPITGIPAEYNEFLPKDCDEYKR